MTRALVRMLNRRSTYIAVMIAWILAALVINAWVWDIPWWLTIPLLWVPTSFLFCIAVIPRIFPRFAWED